MALLRHCLVSEPVELRQKPWPGLGLASAPIHGEGRNALFVFRSFVEGWMEGWMEAWALVRSVLVRSSTSEPNVVFRRLIGPLAAAQPGALAAHGANPTTASPKRRARSARFRKWAVSQIHHTAEDFPRIPQHGKPVGTSINHALGAP
ncbi:hypothetical protein VTJ04DRAFT_49 [Mycothermus thermophilus]|uniref:uncharacterized protein n=1 Tax=Humicola insolens TaxID=85995 RepID=UPI003742EDD8